MDHIPRSSVPQLGKSEQSTPEQSQGPVHSLSNCIPPELLESIFNRAIPPHALLDQTACSEDRPPWCHTLQLMKSITLVCRSWNKVGTGFLYQHICIRFFHQLENLRETLYTSNSSHRKLGALVKSLDIQCDLSEKLAPKFAENLCAIMKLCPFVSTFKYTSPCTLPPSALPTSCLKSQITHLWLHHTVPYTDLVSILRDLQDQLLALHFDIFPDDSPFQVVPDPKLIFPSLLTLSLSDWGSDKPLLNVLKADWSMPSLQRFTKRDYIALNERSQEAIIDFLSTHGRRLLYLHIGSWSPFGHPFSKALEHCPHLDRLVMHAATFEQIYGMPKNAVLHPKLRFLDLTYSFRERFDYTDCKLWISKEVLPSLELVRHLCDIPSYLNAWVDSFEPCLDIGSDDFTIWLFQHQVIYKYGVLLYDFKRNETKIAMEPYQEPEMSWRFTKNVTNDEHSGSEDEPFNPGVSSSSLLLRFLLHTFESMT